MNCRKCGGHLYTKDNVNVKDENGKIVEILRRRVCNVCGEAFFTSESFTNFSYISEDWYKYYRRNH